MSYDETKVASDFRARQSAEQSDDLPMFRSSDPETSREAAAKVAEHLTALQARVVAAFKTHGAITAKEAEQLPEFADLGFSTVRKRISELARAKEDGGPEVLVAIGSRQGATVYLLAVQQRGDVAA